MKRTCLIIDDEEPLRTFIREVLIMFKFEVLEAGSGREAIEIIQKKKTVDLIFLDMNLPEMDGEDVYHEICKICSECYVIFMSGYDLSKEITKFGKAKAHRFLKKPFGIKEIKTTLEEILPI